MPKRPKKILVTGQSGLGKSKFLEEAKKFFPEQGDTVLIETLGHKMIENYDRGIDEHTILNLPRPLLDFLRFSTCKDILRDLKELDKNIEYYILNTHAVFRWHHGLIPCLDIDFSLDFNPEIIICLIDDILKVKKGLQDRNTDFFLFGNYLLGEKKKYGLVNLQLNP